MSKLDKKQASELFIVDNSDDDWKVLNYLKDWCEFAVSMDIATGFFEIGSLLALDGDWQKLDKIRILLGDEVSLRTKDVFQKAFDYIQYKLDSSIESEKEVNDFLSGVPAIAEALANKKIECRVYRKKKFHAKAYITHAKSAVIGSSALVGSSNFTKPGILQNVELNINIRREVDQLQAWFDQHWDDAEDVTPDILRTVERHIREYIPFEVYLKSLHEYYKGHLVSASEWEKNHSLMYKVLAPYQQEAYHSLINIANNWNGAFLCDGVGLGKTFVGLMLLERLLVLDRKRVVLLVPKSARKPVWEKKILKYMPKLLNNPFVNLKIYNHTDLLRGSTNDRNFQAEFEQIKNDADVFIIDEAHNFRNVSSSRYRKLIDIIGGTKEVFLLTATPINNTLIDLQHQIELFTNHDDKYFSRAPLSIHSLTGHFRKMVKDLEQAIIDDAYARNFLVKDDLFREIVVQRSRSYVLKNLEQQEDRNVLFPIREAPVVADYSLKKVYGEFLNNLEKAFKKEKPLFKLPVYYPYDTEYFKGDLTKVDSFILGRKAQVVALIRILFLKRFESSIAAFRFSCENLLMKLLSFVEQYRPKMAERWKHQHEDMINTIIVRRTEPSEEENEEDAFPEEFNIEWEKLDENEFDISALVSDTIMDMDELLHFLDDIKDIDSSRDDKLQSLIKLLKTNEDLKKYKVLIFSEFLSTARYLRDELSKAGFTELYEIDSESKADRGLIIERFSPYYNDTTSEQLKQNKHDEIRILISTDVLSEGLNLQDGNLVINYDLHWNPVRLMQRIGRVDRRLDSVIEEQMLADHPELKDIRGKVKLWNFLPPAELDKLLSLYQRVSSKTLKISKTFGIEGKKLLKPEDDYDALKEFNNQYTGETTDLEELYLKYKRLIKENPTIATDLDSMPWHVFTGKKYPDAESRSLFLCYRFPSINLQTGEWSLENGFTSWYLYNLATDEIKDDVTLIDPVVSCEPDTQRFLKEDKVLLKQIRKKIELHIHNTYMRKAQVPVVDSSGSELKPKLIAWMEMSQP